MPVSTNKRLPINCEPCRLRKIRCPRDATPCGTCRRRGISSSQCVYTSRLSLERTSSAPRQRSPISLSSTLRPFGVSADDTGLIERVKRLEQALLCQSGNQLSSIDAASGPEDYYCSPQSNGSKKLSSDDASQAQKDPKAAPVGRLHTSPTGHVRYLPHGSMWDSVMSQRSIEECPGATSATFDIPPLTRKDKTIEMLLDKLPAVEHCECLKDVYFASFAPLFHLLHDPTFHQQYRSFKSDPNSASLSWLALLFAVLATAVNALNEESHTLHNLSRKSTVSEKIADLSEKYRQACLECLEADSYMWQHNITTLQALIILIYGINHSHGQSWTLLGLTYNLALSLGCHIDPSHFELNIVRAEERRRCWAGLMMLYTVQNTCMGNLGLPRLAADVHDPADIDDDRLDTRQHLPVVESGSATQMSYLLLKFRLYNICSDICEQVLSMIDPNPAVIDDLDARIHSEQEHWEMKYLIHTGAGSLPVAHLVHINILYGYSHQLSLLLHRPILIACSSTDSARYENSRQTCIKSAHNLLQIHKSFYDSSHFAPFAWYNRGLGSFHAFHAAIVLIVVLAECEDMTLASELRQMLNECEDRFNKMADLSPICRKAAPVLRHLLSISSSSNSPPSADTANAGYAGALPNAGRAATAAYCSATNLDPLANNADLPGNVNTLLEHFTPQQWINPAGMDWDQWDYCVSNMAITNNA